MGEFWVKGPQALAFLQKITSNNVAALAPGKIQYTCFPNEDGGIVSVFLPVVKVFHIQTALPSVYPPCFFHKLKTLWRKFKTQAFKPVFRVEFHTFHKVFHNLISTGSEPFIHFVIFKSEL